MHLIYLLSGNTDSLANSAPTVASITGHRTRVYVPSICLRYP